MSDVRKGRDRGETGPRDGLRSRARACCVERLDTWKCKATCEKGGDMASVSVPPGVPLREATQRKLRRFSELRGTRVPPGIRKGGTCREVCRTITSA